MSGQNRDAAFDAVELARRLIDRLEASGFLDHQRRQTAGGLFAQGVSPTTALVRAGVEPTAVRAALAEATGLPCCPVTPTFAPDPALRAGFPDEVWRAAKAVPFARDGATLHVAFADPSTIAAAARSLPPHVAFACLEDDVVHGLARAAPAAAPPAGIVGTAMLDAVMPAPAASPPSSPSAPGTLVLDAAMVASQRTALFHGGALVQGAPSSATAVMFVGEHGTATAPPPAPPPVPVSAPRPDRIGPFRIEGVLGQGGMATVYRGIHEDGRVAAVKVVHPHLLHQPMAKERFLREARATERLRHTNVVAVLGSGEDQGTAWLAVEFVEGGSVADLLRRCGRLPLFAALEIVAQTADALGAAHGLGVVHRDLKPDNLLLSRDGVVKLADFGIARDLEATAMTGTGSTLGTPAYMSPEQAMAKPLDGRSDLYALGVILYELLVGTNPFEGDSLGTTVARILQQKVPPLFEVDPSVPEAVDGIVSQLIRFSPDDRPKDAATLNELLRPLVEEERRRFPGLLRELVARPESAAVMRRRQADDLVVAARALLPMGAAAREPAAMCLFRAVTLCPDHDDAQRLLTDLEAAHGLRFGPARSPKVADVERELASTPDDPVLLQRAAQLWRQDGNVYKAAVYLRRSLKVRPDDQHARGQLSRLVVVPPSATSVDIAAHIATGGFFISPTTSPSIGPPSPTEQVPRVRLTEAPPPEAGGFVDQLRALVAVHGRTIAAVVVVGGIVVGAVSGVRGFIDSSRTSIDEAWQRGPQPPAGPVDDDADGKALAAAESAFSKGLYAEAVREAGTVVDRNARASLVARALLLRARARLGEGKALPAIEDLTRLIDRYGADDTATEALLLRARAYAGAGENERAHADIDACLKRSPQAPTKAGALIERGALRARAGDAAGAREALESGLSYLKPGTPDGARAREILATLPSAP